MRITGGIEDRCGEIIAQEALKGLDHWLTPIDARDCRPQVLAEGKPLLADICHDHLGTHQKRKLCDGQADRANPYDEYSLLFCNLCPCDCMGTDGEWLDQGKLFKGECPGRMQIGSGQHRKFAQSPVNMDPKTCR